LLATAVLYLPPASIAARLDAWVFDLWSHLDPPLPAAEIVIAEADTPAALAHVVELADDAGAKLIVGTLADTPATQLDRLIGELGRRWNIVQCIQHRQLSACEYAVRRGPGEEHRGAS